MRAEVFVSICRAPWCVAVKGGTSAAGRAAEIPAAAAAQVVPALDPDTPIYAGGFPMQLIKRRMQEYNLWNEKRFKTFNMTDRFQLGPFE